MSSMDWQKQALQQAAQQPLDEGRSRLYPSEAGLRQQRSSSSGAGWQETTTLGGPGLGGPSAAAVSAEGTPYLYPPEWQQRGQPQLPQPAPWGQQLQQQQMSQQQLQQQQGLFAQQATAAPPSPRTGGSARPPRQQHGRSSQGSRWCCDRGVYSSSSDVYANSSGPGGESDRHIDSCAYVGSRSSYGGAVTSSHGSRSYGSTSSMDEGSSDWPQQQLLLLEQEQQQRTAVQEVEEQCMRSLHSSLRMAAETNEISQKTAVKLDEQSEQLREIRDTAAEIQENLQTSDYLLKGMKSWWGAFAQLFTSPPAAKAKSSRAPTEAAEAAATASQSQRRSRPSRAADEREGAGAVGAAGAGQQQQQLTVREAASQRRVGAVSSDFDVRLEQDLQKLSQMLGEMHERAVAINSNLKQQNGMLSEIEKNMDANQSSIVQQKKVLKEIMRK